MPVITLPHTKPGHVRATPVKNNTALGYVELPTPLQVPAVGTITLEPTNEKWCWKLETVIYGVDETTEYVTVSPVDTSARDLIRVDPGTFTSSHYQPEPSWWAALRAGLKAASGEPGEDGKDGKDGDNGKDGFTNEQAVKLLNRADEAVARAETEANTAVGVVTQIRDNLTAETDKAVTRANIPGIVVEAVGNAETVVAAAAAAVDANPKIAALETSVLQRGDIRAGDTLDRLINNSDQGRWRVISTQVGGTPGAFIGYVDVSRNPGDGVVTHVFTRSAVTSTEVSWFRTYANTVFSGWTGNSWNRGRALGGTLALDFNTFTTPGSTDIQSITHANMPSSVIGNLEYLPTANYGIQRYTTHESKPRIFTRRHRGVNIFDEWSEPSKSLATPYRGALNKLAATATTKRAFTIVGALSKDRTTGWATIGNTIRSTTDDGVTWQAGKVFTGENIESVNELDNNELMVQTVSGTASMRKIYISENYGKPAETWNHVLTGSKPSVKFAPSWSISTYENIVLLNEYGPKAGATWGGGSTVIADGDNARYLYLSTDYGKTWTTIFDLNTYITSKGTSTNGQHPHGVAWDPYWDRIWYSFGDNNGGSGSNGILYSDDLGETWKEAHYFKGANGTQTVGILPMPNCVLFAGDVNPSGILRINRNEGKLRSAPYTIQTAYDAPEELGTHLCQGISRISRRGDDGPALFAFCAEIIPATSFAIATLDGYSFTEIWRETETQPIGMGPRSIVGPTKRGNIIIAHNDLRVEGNWTEIKTKGTGY